jgi:hypothetical protein
LCNIQQLGLCFRIRFLRNRAAGLAAGITGLRVKPIAARSDEAVQNVMQMRADDVDIRGIGRKAGVLRCDADCLLRIGHGYAGNGER